MFDTRCSFLLAFTKHGVSESQFLRIVCAWCADHGSTRPQVLPEKVGCQDPGKPPSGRTPTPLTESAQTSARVQ